MKHIKNAVIVSGGNIDVDFALDFFEKNKKKRAFYDRSGQRTGVF